MSETGADTPSGILDATGRKLDTGQRSSELEPLVQFAREQPVCLAVAALCLGFLLGKML
jgi:hypothetical protein